MDILKMAREKKVLLVSHRGVCGGNIPCNSLQAFKIALDQGADIIELDVDRSSDNVLFVQHPGMEKVHLRMKDSIKNFSAAALETFSLSNCDLTRTQWTLVKLYDALKMLKGKCIINIDKFWENPKLIADMVYSLDMKDDVLIKTANKPEYIDMVEKYASDIPFMVIASGKDDSLNQFKERNINFIGVEAIFTTDDDYVASKEYLKLMHDNNKIVWANGLVYNYKAVLSAGHSDDISLLESPDKGWGWLADRGFDIIQTDFLLPCRLYLEKSGKRK